MEIKDEALITAMKIKITAKWLNIYSVPGVSLNSSYAVSHLIPSRTSCGLCRYFPNVRIRKLSPQEGKAFPQHVQVIDSRVGVCIWPLYHMLLPIRHTNITTFVSQILVRMLIYKNGRSDKYRGASAVLGGEWRVSLSLHYWHLRPDTFLLCRAFCPL